MGGAGPSQPQQAALFAGLLLRVNSITCLQSASAFLVMITLCRASIARDLRSSSAFFHHTQADQNFSIEVAIVAAELTIHALELDLANASADPAPRRSWHPCCTRSSLPLLLDRHAPISQPVAAADRLSLWERPLSATRPAGSAAAAAAARSVHPRATPPPAASGTNP